MIEGDAYATMVRRTFRTRALRSVLIIDDQFPTYSDLVDGKASQFADGKLAAGLYKMFKGERMPCDIENDVGEITDDLIERIRKSDLIVLDYHLTANSTDTSKSIAVVRKLSSTKHFNTIILYTRDKNVKGVWREIACSLRGGWIAPEDILDDEAMDLWDTIIGDHSEALRPSDRMIAGHLTGGARAWPKEERNQLRKTLEELGFKQPQIRSVICALVEREIGDVLKIGSGFSGENEPSILGRYEDGGPLWLQSHNCFLVILNKDEEEEADEHPARSDRILRCLDDALNDWRPNLLQVLMSEIQNLLEFEAFVTEEVEFRDPATHTGLAYYLLRSIDNDTDPGDADRMRPPLQTIIDKLLDAVRHQLAGDQELITFATDLLSAELQRIDWVGASSRSSRATGEVFKDAEKIIATKTQRPSNRPEAIFELNRFLSTEAFHRSHVTTGTVFVDRNTEEYWICASPACDMVDRRPSAVQTWMRRLHPLRPMVAVKLTPEPNFDGRLGEAEFGRHIFLKDQETDERRCFSAVELSSHQPVIEMFFVEKAARVTKDDSGVLEFQANRIDSDATTESEPPRGFKLVQLSVLGQLRPRVAARLLQATGQHLSRIGVDFVNMPG